MRERERKRPKENIETGSQGKRRTGTDRQTNRQMKKITAVIESNKEKGRQRGRDIHNLYIRTYSRMHILSKSKTDFFFWFLRFY